MFNNTLIYSYKLKVSMISLLNSISYFYFCSRQWPRRGGGLQGPNLINSLMYWPILVFLCQKKRLGKSINQKENPAKNPAHKRAIVKDLNVGSLATPLGHLSVNLKRVFSAVFTSYFLANIIYLQKIVTYLICKCSNLKLVTTSWTICF